VLDAFMVVLDLIVCGQLCHSSAWCIISDECKSHVLSTKLHSHVITSLFWHHTVLQAVFTWSTVF